MNRMGKSGAWGLEFVYSFNKNEYRERGKFDFDHHFAFSTVLSRESFKKNVQNRPSV